MQSRRLRASHAPNLTFFSARVGSLSSCALLFALTAACSSAEPAANQPRDDSESVASEGVSAKRVVGYLPHYRDSLSYWTSTLDFSALTHVTLAFASLDTGASDVEIHYRQQGASSGDEPGLTEFVKRAHESSPKVKVCLAIGGASGSDALGAEIVKDPVGLANKVAKYAETNELDCIDVDQEEEEAKRTDELDAAYGNFIRALAPLLHGMDKELTAAVSRWKPDKILPVIGEFDFMSPMAYDYNLADSSPTPVQASPLEQSEAEMKWWVGKGADPTKLVWGVPFYGYQWTPNGKDGEAIAYRTIIDQRGSEPTEDEIELGTSTVTLNSSATIRSKARIAKANYGGVMIWELWQDTTDLNWSLLQAIKSEMTQ